MNQVYPPRVGAIEKNEMCEWLWTEKLKEEEDL